MAMKIAFLALVHKDPAQVARLVRVLGREGDEVFIHVDRLSDIADFERHLASTRGSSVHLLAERYSIAWGGWSMIRATNALIEAAVRRCGFDYFYLLSGQCFPIRPVSWLKSMLAEGKEYIKCLPMPQPSKPMSRLERRVVKVKTPELRDRGRRLAEMLLNLVPVRNFQATFGLAPHAGSQWWCLSSEAIEHVRAYRQARPAYDRFMKWTDTPDEMYYQTLVANGPRRERIATSLTGAIWIEGRHHPEVLTRRDLPVLLNRPVFLGRKFLSDDVALLDELEKIALGVGDASVAP